MTNKEAQIELMRIAQTPPPIGFWSFSYFGASDSCDLHHFKGNDAIGSMIAKNFRLWSPDMDEDSPEAIVAGVRAYLATLTSSQLSSSR